MLHEVVKNKCFYSNPYSCNFSFRHEAEFYGIAPLVKRLMLCQDLHHSSCGDVLFCGYLSPPSKLNIVDNRCIDNSCGKKCIDIFIYLSLK